MLHMVYHYYKGRFSQSEIDVVTEIPFRIMVDGVELATMMCTPVKLRELALGFLAFERIIESMDDVVSVEVDEDESDAGAHDQRDLFVEEKEGDQQGVRQRERTDRPDADCADGGGGTVEAPATDAEVDEPGEGKQEECGNG